MTGRTDKEVWKQYLLTKHTIQLYMFIGPRDAKHASQKTDIDTETHRR